MIMNDYRYYKRKLYHENGIYLTRKYIGKFFHFYGDWLYVAYWGDRGVITGYVTDMSISGVLEQIKQILEVSKDD